MKTYTLKIFREITQFAVVRVEVDDAPGPLGTEERNIIEAAFEAEQIAEGSADSGGNVVLGWQEARGKTKPAHAFQVVSVASLDKTEGPVVELPAFKPVAGPAPR